MENGEMRVKAASLQLTMQIMELRNQDLDGISHALSAICLSITEMLRL